MGDRTNGCGNRLNRICQTIEAEIKKAAGNRTIPTNKLRQMVKIDLPAQTFDWLTEFCGEKQVIVRGMLIRRMPDE